MKTCVYNGVYNDVSSVDCGSKNIAVCFNTRHLFTDYTVLFPRPENALFILNANF